MAYASSTFAEASEEEEEEVSPSIALISDAAAETARAAEFALADGVIVTGMATGCPADPAEVEAVAAAVVVPTLVGSGVTADTVDLFAAADGLIVGSAVKQRGDWRLPLDRDAVGRLVDAFLATDHSR